MLVKLLYSALLAAVALAAAGELLRVWTDNRLYIGAFDVASADGEEKGKAFAAQVGLAHALIFHQLQEYNQRGIGGTSDTTYNIAPDEQATVFDDRLADLALTYQEVNIGQLLSSLRKSLAQPNEVSGVVTELGGQSWARVTWPRAPAIGGKVETSFLTDTRSDLPGSVRQVACSLAWAQVVNDKSASDKLAGIKAAIADMGRSRFCRWVEALDVYSSLLAKRQNVNLDTIAPWRGELKAMAEAGVRFPDIFRLRADFTDLLTPDERWPLLPEAQDDRLQYALLTDPELQKLPVEERLVYAHGLARPALVLEDGKLRGLRDNWRPVLEPYSDTIERTAAVVGLLRRDDFSGGMVSAFRIGPDLIMSVKFAYRDPFGQPASEAQPIAEAIKGLSFYEGDVADGEDPMEKRFPVTGVVYDGGENSHIAILRIAGRRSSARLRLRDTAVPAETLVDQYVYMIAYPLGVKRLLPGRTLPLDTDTNMTVESLVLFTDINTSAGTSGAPLIDLASGRVIGVHIGSRFDPKKKKSSLADLNKGRFPWAELITPAINEIVEKALAPAGPAGQRGEPAAALSPALSIAPAPEAQGSGTTGRR